MSNNSRAEAKHSHWSCYANLGLCMHSNRIMLRKNGLCKTFRYQSKHVHNIILLQSMVMLSITTSLTTNSCTFV